MQRRRGGDSEAPSCDPPHQSWTVRWVLGCPPTPTATPGHWGGSPGRDRFSSRAKDQLLSPEWRAGGTTQHRYRKRWEAFLSGPGGYFCSLFSGAQGRRGTSSATVPSEESSAPELARGWGQTGNGIGDRGLWARACASSPLLPPPLRMFSGVSTKSLPLLLLPFSPAPDP